MKSQRQLDWVAIRDRASQFSEESFNFVRDGLGHTVKAIYGEVLRDPDPSAPADERYHVSGQQLCLGLRDLAIERYGLLAKAVLTKWGLRRTDDFGVIVYSMIDRQELRSSDRDSFEDFAGVFDFDEAFGEMVLK